MPKGGYSGSTSFTFTIERYVDNITNNIISIEDIDSNLSESDIEEKYTLNSFDLEVEGNSWYSPGVYSRAPEDCYPDEGDTEIESVKGPDGEDCRNLLTSEEENKIIETIESNCSSNDTYDSFYHEL
jgi:hypothetical protein